MCPQVFARPFVDRNALIGVKSSSVVASADAAAAIGTTAVNAARATRIRAAIEREDK